MWKDRYGDRIPIDSETVEMTKEIETENIGIEGSSGQETGVAQISGDVSENFVLIPGGTFQMRSPESEAWLEENGISHNGSMMPILTFKKKNFYT